MRILRNINASPLLWLTAIAGASLLSSVVVTAAGLKGSKHDLSGNSDSRSAVCVFCHAPNTVTPTTASGEPVLPLWNQQLSQTTPFKTYNSLGLSSGEGEARHGSVSMACLSCHDGSQAPDVLTGTSSSRAIAGSQPSSAARGNELGVHPFGIPYKGIDAKINPEFSFASKLMINGSPVWWVDSGRGRPISVGGLVTSSKTGQREKTDIQLYSKFVTEYEGAESTEVPYVECASCHNPHTSETSTFLRFDNIGSGLCLSCHIK